MTINTSFLKLITCIYFINLVEMEEPSTEYLKSDSAKETPSVIRYLNSGGTWGFHGCHWVREVREDQGTLWSIGENQGKRKIFLKIGKNQGRFKVLYSFIWE